MAVYIASLAQIARYLRSAWILCGGNPNSEVLRPRLHRPAKADSATAEHQDEYLYNVITNFFGYTIYLAGGVRL